MEDRMTREQMISAVINSKYTIDDQIAILRQKDTKPEEYDEFFQYAESVKEAVTAEYKAIEEAEAAAAAANVEEPSAE